jgi:hypothetical protein
MRHASDQPRPAGVTPTPEEQRRRRLRNFWTFLGVTCLLVALTGAELYVQGLHRVLPLANNIVIFAIVNLNILLLLALVLLVLRNLVKLYYERRGRIIGSRFRTKLVIAFFGLSFAIITACSSRMPCTSASNSAQPSWAGISYGTTEPQRWPSF